jgi:ABC-type transporter MlaC component
MTEFLAATIAGRLELETNQPTQVLETIAGPRDSQIVRTLSLQGDEAIRVDYRLTQGQGGWAIVDIVADTKISEVARRRAEFLGIIRTQGHAGIVAAIEEKIRELERTGG